LLIWKDGSYPFALKSPNTAFILITILLFILIFGLGIFSDGMFFDGIVYANVARNYANGLGSFWEMYYGNNLDSQYHDQPPLAFFLLAQFYKIFGDSIYVERFYDFAFAIIHLFVIKYLWGELTGHSNKYYWLPILLWISIPLCSWTFKNNLMEITMGAFDLAAVILILKGCRQNKNIFLLIGSVFILFASLSKGFQGLFPIMTPFFFWLTQRRMSFKSMLIKSLLAISIPVLSYIIFYLTPEINQSITLYLKQRIVGTFNHVQDTKKSRFYLLFKLLLELSLPAFLVFITWLTERKNSIKLSIDKKSVYLLLLIGMSASLPLMVTLEQRAFYLTTSLPYYSIALALIALPFVASIFERLSVKRFDLINYILIVLIFISGVFISINSHKPKRDLDLLTDLYLLKEIIPEGGSISIPPEMNNNWAYNAYFMRYCYLKLEASEGHPFFLTERMNETPGDACYQPVDLLLKKFKLYKCEKVIY